MSNAEAQHWYQDEIWWLTRQGASDSAQEDVEAFEGV
jgi:hypothetical protein